MIIFMNDVNNRSFEFLARISEHLTEMKWLQNFNQERHHMTFGCHQGDRIWIAPKRYVTAKDELCCRTQMIPMVQEQCWTEYEIKVMGCWQFYEDKGVINCRRYMMRYVVGQATMLLQVTNLKKTCFPCLNLWHFSQVNQNYIISYNWPVHHWRDGWHMTDMELALHLIVITFTLVRHWHDEIVKDIATTCFVFWIAKL